jgi:hypothetical protein
LWGKRASKKVEMAELLSKEEMVSSVVCYWRIFCKIIIKKYEKHYIILVSLSKNALILFKLK